MAVSWKFLGGVGTVTGSRHILEVDGEKILIDFGLFQGRRKEAREINTKFSFAPASLKALILPHAHIDHSGNVPNLVKNGFSGPIYSTFATRNLCAVMLKDSAHIQEEDAFYLNKKYEKKGLPPLEPLYTTPDAINCLHQFVSMNYDQGFRIGEKVQGTFYDAGHILGSALLLLEVKGMKIGYAVDLGRRDLPILRDPYQLKNLDFLIMESTYGDRFHEDIGEAEKRLGEIIKRTAGRGGKIIIPAFALERTQELIYLLGRLKNRNAIPDIPVFVDSPLAVNVTEVYRLHPECFDQETFNLFLSEEQPFNFPNLTYIRKVEKSKALHQLRTPCIIISASGMCEAGRILHHLKNNLENPQNTILIVGFMAKNTLGRRIVEKAKEVKIFDLVYKVRAEVMKMNFFSAHADRKDLLEYAGKIGRSLKQIFLVHGEEKQTSSLREALSSQGFSVSIPRKEEEVSLS